MTGAAPLLGVQWAPTYENFGSATDISLIQTGTAPGPDQLFS